MRPSPYQRDIYSWVKHGSGSAIIEAVAGSGKTTTLQEICKLIPRDEAVRFFAFNKPIADTLKGRISRSNVIISTYHSAGYQAILRHLGVKVETNKRKMWSLLREWVAEADQRAYGEPLLRLVSLMKGSGFLTRLQHQDTNLSELIDHHDLDFDWLIPPGRMSDDQLRDHLIQERNRVIGIAIDLLDKSNEAAGQQFEWDFDFDDQMYLPLLWDLPLPTYPWVLIDEAQDTNDVQREFARRSLAPGGRLIAVGDSHQAIYGWRGASHDAMALIQREFNATPLPLSICWRCPRSVIRKAQTLVPQIEWCETATEGEVKYLVPLEALATLTKHDAILCRNNAPIVSVAYQLIGKGIPVRVLGRDIGEGLTKLIDKLHAHDALDLEKRLLVWRDREMKRYRELGQESKAQGVEDKAQCIQTILESLEDRTIENLITAIEQLFGDRDQEKLTLSTVHKAKGQEWDRVAIIRSDLMPSFWAKQPWQQLQEANLQYVAWTRPQVALWFMDDEPEWKKKKRERAGVDWETVAASDN